MRVNVFFRRGAWWIEYRPQGRQGARRREKIGPDKKLAEAVAAKRQVEVAEGRFLDVKRKSKTTFREMARQYMDFSKANKRSWKRDRTSIRSLRKAFDGKSLADITPRQIEQHKARRAQQVSPQSVNHELQCLRHLYTKAIEWGECDTNPAASVKKMTVRNARLRYLSDDEETRLLDSCAPHLRPIIVVALDTGMREGEVLGLKWADIDFDNGLIHLEETKNGRRRDIPMCRRVRRTLTEHPRRLRSPYVFCKPSGEPYGRVDKGMRGACERAEIQGVVFHTLRHTFASRLVMEGVDLVTVKELLGHSSLAMVMRYAHLSPEHRRKAVAALDRRASGPRRGPRQNTALPKSS